VEPGGVQPAIRSVTKRVPHGLRRTVYDSVKFKVSGFERCERPECMYIGDTDAGNGVHQMVFEGRNSIDESPGAHCDPQRGHHPLPLNRVNSVSVDNGSMASLWISYSRRVRSRRPNVIIDWLLCIRAVGSS